jgi:hypothetical protein
MRQLITPSRRLEYKDYVIYKGKEYQREEYIIFKFLHTISWRLMDDEDNLVEYFSRDMGWSGKDGHLNKKNPVPEIELEFKRTIGKDLIYF